MVTGIGQMRTKTPGGKTGFNPPGTLRSCFEMIEKLFEVKFLHLLPESSGQIATAIFPESPLEPEGFSAQTFR